MRKVIWKDVVGYEGLYQVSNNGEVRSMNYKNTGEVKILALHKNHGGYLHVSLCKDGKEKKWRVHRLVAKAFLPNPENKPQVDHINGDITDNRVENLRWVTGKENCANPIYKHKAIILQYSKNGDFIKQWDRKADIKEELGICLTSVYKCCIGQRYEAGGYRWRYAS